MSATIKSETKIKTPYGVKNWSFVKRVFDTHQDLIDALREVHQDEIDNNHYGDGKTGCSYCQLLERAES